MPEFIIKKDVTDVLEAGIALAEVHNIEGILNDKINAYKELLDVVRDIQPVDIKKWT